MTGNRNQVFQLQTITESFLGGYYDLWEELLPQIQKCGVGCLACCLLIDRSNVSLGCAAR